MIKRVFIGLVLGVVLISGAVAQAQFGTTGGPKLSYEVVPGAMSAPQGETTRVAVTFHLDAGWHVQSNMPLDEFNVATELSVETAEGLVVGRTGYPEHELIDFAGSPLAVFGEEFTIAIEITPGAGIAPGEQVLSATLRYQACDDKMCMPPKNLSVSIPITVSAAGTPVEAQNDAVFASLVWTTGADEATTEQPTEPAETAPVEESSLDWKTLAQDFRMVSTSVGMSDATDFIAFVENKAPDADAAPPSGWATLKNVLSGKGGLEDLSWGVIVLSILIGGFLLNLTPCVLPMIPINIGIIGAGAQAGSRGRGFALGGAFGLGIALVYGVLGLVVILGVSSTFGAINSTIGFNLGIAVLFVVLALAMFDVIAIDFSKYQAKIGVRENKGGSFFIALFMGGVSALLAGACVAPVVIQTIVYSQDQYAKGQTLALALPFLLGVGMALPWPFAGGGLSFLPKPGLWMVRVKQGFGIFILLFAAYYGYLAYTIYEARNVDPDAVVASVAAADEDGWVHSLEEGLAQAKAEGKPVLLDFWATWCKNCLVMNKTTLKDASVLEALEGHVKIKYQAEIPDVSPTREVMEYFGVLGLPTYILLEPID